MTAGDADEDTGAGSEEEPSSREQPDPTPQSEALRRQQLFVGSGVAVVGGFAVFVATAQRYPGLSFPVYLAAGMVTTALLFGLTFAGIFRGEE